MSKQFHVTEATDRVKCRFPISDSSREVLPSILPSFRSVCLVGWSFGSCGRFGFIISLTCTRSAAVSPPPPPLCVAACTCRRYLRHTLSTSGVFIATSLPLALRPRRSAASRRSFAAGPSPYPAAAAHCAFVGPLCCCCCCCCCCCQSLFCCADVKCAVRFECQ